MKGSAFRLSTFVPLCATLLLSGCSEQLSGGIVDAEGEFGLGLTDEEEGEEGEDEEGKEEGEDSSESDGESSGGEESGGDSGSNKGDRTKDSDGGSKESGDETSSTGGSKPKDKDTGGDSTDSGPGKDTTSEPEPEPEPEPEKVEGDLKIVFTTKSYSGRFAPRNAGAVWIESKDGTFLRTLKKWALVRTRHLVRWRKATGSDTADAITGATLQRHQKHSLKWDRKDHKGKSHGVGDYVLRVEFTEENSSGPAKPGPTLQVPFHLGGGSKTLNPDDVRGYSSIELVTPD